MKSRNPLIKDFILNYGSNVINFMAWVSIIIGIITFAICMSMFFENMSILTFLIMIFAPILIILPITILNYFIYLLIDIRDHLNEIKSNLPPKK